MTKPTVNASFSKSRTLALLEYILLGFCLCVIALRAVFTEAPNVQSATQLINLSDSARSLSISAGLFLSFVVWFIWSLCSKRFLYRFTAIEIGLFLFCVAAVFAGFAAANKRAAITSFATLLPPILMAILLVQILDSHSKIKLLLYTIATLGAVAALYCVCQWLWINPLIINQYQADPNALLEKMGIIPGSYRHMLFEHSLNSRDIRGFFTTGNSAGSFVLLASFAAVGLFIENLKNLKSNLLSHRAVLVSGIIAFMSIFGLVITHSKGAIIASLIAAIMFFTYLSFGKWLTRHKKTILIGCLLLGLAGGYAVVSYGLTHDRLPGGKSMLVRWQYWRASVQMYVDHPITGVGPGNFAHFYPHYKIASAPETVADPHNFLLSILTQYGPLGLIGFLSALLVPLVRIVLAAQAKSAQNNHTMQTHNIMRAALFFAIFGFLLHNCIDFAIFEPGNMTTFWAVIACLIALDFQQKNRAQFALKPAILVRIPVAAAAVLSVWAYFNYALMPVAGAAEKTKQAMQDLRYAHELLQQAAQADRLDPTALNLNGRLYLQHYNDTGKNQPDLLKKAVQCFRSAIDRDEADYKNYEKLSTVYNLLAETSTPDEKAAWLYKAFDSAQAAAEHYPGCARVRIELAKIAEQLGKTDIAIKHYKQAVTIEDQYRVQFRLMYPGREVFSRLGEEKYQFAKQRIKHLRP